MPGPGLISERSHTAGEKIHCAAFGWVREVLDLKGHNVVRLRPSAPTASLIFRILLRACSSCRRFSSFAYPLHISSNVLFLVLSSPVGVSGQALFSRSRYSANSLWLNFQSPCLSRA